MNPNKYALKGLLLECMYVDATVNTVSNVSRLHDIFLFKSKWKTHTLDAEYEHLPMCFRGCGYTRAHLTYLISGSFFFFGHCEMSFFAIFIIVRNGQITVTFFKINHFKCHGRVFKTFIMYIWLFSTQTIVPNLSSTKNSDLRILIWTTSQMAKSNAKEKWKCHFGIHF